MKAITQDINYASLKKKSKLFAALLPTKLSLLILYNVDKHIFSANLILNSIKERLKLNNFMATFCPQLSFSIFFAAPINSPSTRFIFFINSITVMSHVFLGIRLAFLLVSGDIFFSLFILTKFPKHLRHFSPTVC